MNKKLFLLVAFVLSLGLGFTACGDDEEDGPKIDYAAKIVGDYNGKLVVELVGLSEEPTVIPTQNIRIVKLSDNVVKLSVTDFVFSEIGPDPIGNIDIETAVSANNGIFKLADKAGQDVFLLKDEETGVAALKAKAALSSGTVTERKLTLKIKVSDIVMLVGGNEVDVDYTVNVEFSGDKK